MPARILESLHKQPKDNNLKRTLTGRALQEARRRIFLAHSYRCAGCKRVTAAYRLHLDHIVPIDDGGSDAESNLQPLCTGPDSCHEKKTNRERARRGDGRKSL